MKHTFVTLLVGLCCAASVYLWDWHTFADPQQPQHSAFQQAVNTITTQVGYLDSRGPEYRAYLMSLATMNYVQSRLRPSVWAQLRKAGMTKNLASTEQCLVANAGLCGTQVRTFLELAKQLNLPARRVEIYFRRPNGNWMGHTAVEAKWGGKWRFFDVTWGTFFRKPGGSPWDIMSFEAVRTDPDFRQYAVMNHADFWYQQSQVNGTDVFEYVEAQGDILYAGVGELGYRHKSKDGEIRYTFSPMPNTLGKVPDHAQVVADHRVRLEGREAQDTLAMDIAGVHCNRGELIISAGDSSVTLPINNLRPNTLIPLPQADDSVYLRVESADSTCFLRFAALSLR